MQMLLRSGLASACRMVSKNVSARSMAPALVAAPRLYSNRSGPVRAGKSAPPPVEPVMAEDEYEDGDYDPMEGLTAAVRRRVMALKDVQKKYDDVNRQYQAELAKLQAQYLAKYAPLWDERKAVVTGQQAVGTYDIPNDGEEDEKCIPEFWATALMNNDKVGPFIGERDAEVLKHLVDIRTEVLQGEERGFKLSFHFEPNKYFSNTVLEKTYVLEPEEDIVPKKFLGCKIEWKDASLDCTVEQRKRRVKGKDGGKPTFTMDTVPTDSFFNLFDPPQIPEDPDALDDDQMEALQEELSADFDVGYAIKETVIPRAVEWFTGEIAPMGDYGDEYEEGEFEEEEAELPPPPPPKGKGGRR